MLCNCHPLSPQEDGPHPSSGHSVSTGGDSCLRGGSLPAGHGLVALLSTQSAVPLPVTGSSQVKTLLGLHISAKLLDCSPRPRACHESVRFFSAWEGSRLHAAHCSVPSRPLSRFHVPTRPHATLVIASRPGQSATHTAEAKGAQECHTNIHSQKHLFCFDPEPHRHLTRRHSYNVRHFLLID